MKWVFIKKKKRISLHCIWNQLQQWGVWKFDFRWYPTNRLLKALSDLRPRLVWGKLREGNEFLRKIITETCLVSIINITSWVVGEQISHPYRKKNSWGDLEFFFPDHWNDFSILVSFSPSLYLWIEGFNVGQLFSFILIWFHI